MKHRKSPLRVQLPVVLASLLALSSAQAATVFFTNPGLDGTTGYGNAPTGWSGIPNGTTWSEATTADGSQPVLMGATPFGAGLYYGSPQSGTTFAGGIYGQISGGGYQQGIQQTVTGFTVGEQYSFSFYQSVPKYSGATDDTGSWKVFANGVLIQTTAPTTDTVAWNAPGTTLIWEQRTVTFTATAETINFGFLAYDTDGMGTTTGERVMMGIDSFSDITEVPEPSVAALGLIGVLGLLRRRRA